MSRLNIIEKHPGHFIVEGSLTFSSIDKKTVKSLQLVNSKNPVCVDLQNVETTDSAGLALMVEWIKQSKQANQPLTFKHIPQQLQALAKLSGFDGNDYLKSASGNPENTPDKGT